MKNSKRNIFIIIIVTIIVLFLALKNDFTQKIQYLFSINPVWLLIGILLVITYWFLKSLVIYYCTKKFNPNYSLKTAFKLILETQFVNAITPFSTGGHPYQIYKLKKQGLSLDKGTNIVIQDFIVYQIALILLGSIAIICNYQFQIFPANSLLKKLVIFGYMVNLIVIIALFIIAFNKKGNKLILNIAIKIGAKLKLIKNKEQFMEKIDNTISNFHQSASVLMESKIHFIKIIIINFLALTSLYLVPYTLITGLGEDINPILTIISSAYVMLIGSFVPIPGGSGGLEFGFIEFFGTFIQGAKLSSIMIAWRGLTYFLGLFIGALSVSIKEE